ncbi:RNA binding protein [Cryptosporidium ryanae]|uniref:RNA binding protein n=1 Tax=Cryptosporidium ryanae TaxID=515981 RepID=UPI00351A0AC9|nr:RNA binding protein [Cryptosporidium ryanae]
MEDLTEKEIMEEELGLNEENLRIRASIIDLKEDKYGNSSLEGNEKTSFPLSNIAETLVLNKKKTGDKPCPTSNTSKEGKSNRNIVNIKKDSIVADTESSSSFTSCLCSNGSNSKNKDRSKAYSSDRSLIKKEDNKNNIAAGLNRKKYNNSNNNIGNNNDYNQYNHMNITNNIGIYHGHHGLRHIGHARSGNVNMNCLIPSAYPAPNVEIKLFVSGIPINIDEEGLRKLFILYGKVVNVIIIREKNTGIHKGAAVVTMESIAQADFAIRELNSVKVLDELRGPLKVQYSLGESNRLGFEAESCIPGVDQVKLFVGALPKNITEDEVRNIFSPYGYIDEIHIMREHQTGVGKGCAFIRYAYKEQGIFAIRLLNGSLTMSGVNRPIEIRFASKNKVNNSNISFYFGSQILLSSSGFNKAHIPLDSKNNVIVSSFRQEKNFSTNIKLSNRGVSVNSNNEELEGTEVVNKTRGDSKLLSENYKNNDIHKKQYLHCNQNVNHTFQTGRKKPNRNHLNVLSSQKTKQNDTLGRRKIGTSYNQNQNNRRISSLLNKNGVPISPSKNSSSLVKNLMHSRQKLLVLEGDNNSTGNVTCTGADSISSSNSGSNDAVSGEIDEKISLKNTFTRPKLITVGVNNDDNGNIATGPNINICGGNTANGIVIGNRNAKLNLDLSKLSLSTIKANLMPRCIGVWKEYFTSDGRPYYYNELTKITQWEVPSEFTNLISNYLSKEVVGPPGANIFIFNVPYEWNKNTLFMLFYKFGTILSVHLMFDKGNKRNKGVAFVSYDNINSAAEAVNCMDGFMTQQGRRLKVSIKQGQERFVQHLIKNDKNTDKNIEHQVNSDTREAKDNENVNHTDYRCGQVGTNKADIDKCSYAEKTGTSANYTEINTTNTETRDNASANDFCNEKLSSETGTCTKDNGLSLAKEYISDNDIG